jgi:hypothetical protein
MTPPATHKTRARSFLRKAVENRDSAHDNFDLGRYTASAGDAVHAGISAKDAIATVLTGSTAKGKNHATAARELKAALGGHPAAGQAEKAFAELLRSKTDVEYGSDLVDEPTAKRLLRRATTLVELAMVLVAPHGP